jgi:hypothetical protein
MYFQLDGSREKGKRLDEFALARKETQSKALKKKKQNWYRGDALH